MTAALDCRAITKTFRTPQGEITALDGIDLQIQPGEFVSVLGPSGSGKSTLFNIVAGLERPNAGTVWIDGQEATGQRGRVAYMPQRDALLPWRTVLDNAVLAATVARADVRAARDEAERLLPAFGLAGFGDALPKHLSGGMRQRAALLRTVLWQRPLMLLDEPFGALDALTRMQLQAWLLDLWQQLERTVLLVTHDVDEALVLSDRVYVFTPRPGRVALELPVTLPRPRPQQITTNPAFAQLKAHLRHALGYDALPGT